MTFRYFAEHTNIGNIGTYTNGCIDGIAICNNRALEGDTVYYDNDKVTGIVKRYQHLIVAILDIGNLKIYGNNKKGLRYYRVQPLDRHYPDFKVASSYKNQDAKEIYVTVKFIEWTADMETPHGSIETIIGPVTDSLAQERALLYKHNLRYKKYSEDLNIEISTKQSRPVYTNAIAVDPVNCQDRDDAYHIDDEYYYIHIVDMTVYLQHNSPLDLLVRERLTSIYGDQTYHMLPDKLVKKASLSGTGPFYVLTMRLTKDFEFVDLCPSTLMFVDPQHYDDHIYHKSHDFIELLMIKYNTYVADMFKESLLLRTQEPKDKSSWPEEYRFLLENSAQYSVEDQGHSALGLRRYTHATSPMRRYADILVQRLLCNQKIENLSALVQRINNKNVAIKRFYRDLETIRLWRLLKRDNNEDLEVVPINVDTDKLVLYIPKYKRLYYLRCLTLSETDEFFIVDDVPLRKFQKYMATLRAHYVPVRKIILLFIHELRQKVQ